MDDIQIGRADVMGVSMGGMIAQMVVWYNTTDLETVNLLEKNRWQRWQPQARELHGWSLAAAHAVEVDGSNQITTLKKNYRHAYIHHITHENHDAQHVKRVWGPNMPPNVQPCQFWFVAMHFHAVLHVISFCTDDQQHSHVIFELTLSVDV